VIKYELWRRPPRSTNYILFWSKSAFTNHHNLLNTIVLKIIAALILLGLTNKINSNQPTFLYVTLPPQKSCGMFSVFNYVVGVLYEYDKNHYSGIEVNFENSGLYFDPEHGFNWWNYYCEPICLGSTQNSTIKKLTDLEYDYFSSFTEHRLSRWQVFEIIQKYIKPREEIQKVIDQFAHENFSGHHIISVHYRGTDKYLEAPQVSFEQISDAITNYVTQNQLENYRIFVASDEQKFIDRMEQEFPNLIICYPSKRSVDAKPIHYGNSTNTKHQTGEDALIDCILLSHGDYLIRTCSNLSLWSTYFNPSIPVQVLNQRHYKKNEPKSR
jgi:hypothetical protein